MFNINRGYLQNLPQVHMQEVLDWDYIFPKYYRNTWRQIRADNNVSGKGATFAFTLHA